MVGIVDKYHHARVQTVIARRRACPRLVGSVCIGTGGATTTPGYPPYSGKLSPLPLYVHLCVGTGISGVIHTFHTTTVND